MIQLSEAPNYSCIVLKMSKILSFRQAIKKELLWDVLAILVEICNFEIGKMMFKKLTFVDKKTIHKFFKEAQFSPEFQQPHNEQMRCWS